MLIIGIYIAGLVVLIYVWLTWHHGHWKKLKIPYLEPELVFGNIKDFALMRKCKGIVYDELYKKSDEPAVGMFSMRQPQLLIRDPAFYKIVSNNEFVNFKENDVYSEPNDLLLSTNVFFFSGEKWKKNRAIITPALTVSKLKQFLPHMVDIAREMIQYLDGKEGVPMEAKPFAQLFTIETVLSYVYGVKCDSYKNPDSPYRQVFLELLNPSMVTTLKFTVGSLFPSIGHFFKIGLTPPNYTTFFSRVVKETVEYRKKNNVQRKDFLQFLMEASGKNDVPELSIYDMLGLTMNIATDGAETTSLGLNSVMDALIRNPEHQAKLREEIDTKIENIDDITYDNIMSMPYLDAFITESLRVLPLLPLFEKKCTNSCKIEYDGKTYSFKKNDKLAYSSYSVHLDSKYFPNPNEFDPDRFLNSTSDPLGLMIFGSGPRMCLGRRLALIEMKVFLCALLKFYEVLPKGDKAPLMEFDPNSFMLLIVKGGVWFRAKKR